MSRNKEKEASKQLLPIQIGMGNLNADGLGFGAVEVMMMPPAATKEETNKEKKQSKVKEIAAACRAYLKKILLKYRGILYALFSALSIAISSVLIKRVNIYTGSDITFVRYTLQLILMFIIIKRKKLSLLGPKSVRLSLSLRGIFGVVSLISMHFAVKFVDPSDSQSIYNCSILFTAILARIFLKERLNIGHIVSLVMTLIGILLISHPQFIFHDAKQPVKPFIDLNSTALNDTNINSTTAAANNETAIDTGGSSNVEKFIGIGLSLAGAGSAGIVPAIIKFLSNNAIPHPIMIIYASYFGVPASFIISIVLLFVKDTIAERAKFITNSWDLPLETLFVFLSASLGLLSQIGWNLAIKYEDASKSTVVRSSNIVFVFLLQYLFLQIASDFWSIIGAVAIIFGVLFIIVFKVLDEKFSIEAANDKNEKNKSNDHDNDDDDNGSLKTVSIAIDIPNGKIIEYKEQQKQQQQPQPEKNKSSDEKKSKTYILKRILFFKL